MAMNSPLQTDPSALQQKSSQLLEELAKKSILVEHGGIKVVLNGNLEIQDLTVEGTKSQHVIDVLNEAISQAKKVAADRIQLLGQELSNSSSSEPTKVD